MRRHALLCAMLVFCCATILPADLVVVPPSLEMRLANVPCVVRGTVVYADLHKDPITGTSWRLNTVRVDEVLKGPQDKEIVFVEPAESVPSVPLQPANSGSRALFLLAPGKQPRDADRWVLEDHITLQLDPGAAPSDLATTMAFEKIRDPNRLLQVAREICAQDPVWQLDLGGTYISNENGDDIIVPLNARTEAYAVAQSTSTSIHRRLMAVNILTRIKTPSSLEALQTILSHDPATLEIGTGPSRSRYYFVRAEVAARLHEMGLAFTPARLEEPLVGYSPAPHLVIYLAATVFFALAVVILVAAAAPRGRRLAWAFLCCWAMAVLLISAAWIASEHWEQELVISGSNRHRLDSKDGILQYTLAHDWPDRGPALVGSFDSAEIDSTSPSDRAAEDPFMRRIDWHGRFRGLLFKLPAENLIASHGGAGFSVSRGMVEDTFGIQRRFDRYRVPYSFLIALLAIFPATVLVSSFLRTIRHRRHARQGRCPACGYDLRASPQQCPECGRSV